MKRKLVLTVSLLILISSANQVFAQADDEGFQLISAGGNLFLVGNSTAAWGDPGKVVRPFTASLDAFVVKLDKNGTALWTTFLGGFGGDTAYGLVADSVGNLYVAGASDTTWGSPVTTFSGSLKGFVAKLDSNGQLLWNTFVGSSFDRVTTQSIALDPSGNLYVMGNIVGGGGRGGTQDPFIQRLDSNGNPGWLDQLGGNCADGGSNLVLDATGTYVYATGFAQCDWKPYSLKDPILPVYYCDMQAFAGKWRADTGALQWYTFLGDASGDCFSDTGSDRGGAIAVGADGSAYVTGESNATWGGPLRPHTGGPNTFAAKLGSDGALLWNTFLGGTPPWGTSEVKLNGTASVFVTGGSNASWGASPLRAYTAGSDAFLAELTTDGFLQFNTFLGGLGDESGAGIAIDGTDVYVAGKSSATWGNPFRLYSGGSEAFVAKWGGGLTGSLQWNTFLPGILQTNTITASAGTGGTINPSGTVTVSRGGSQTFAIAPASGNVIADVRVDGVSVGAVATYTFTGVTENRAIAASFAARQNPFDGIWIDCAGCTQSLPGSRGIRDGSYQVRYLSNLNIGDSYVDIANPGTVSGNDPAGRICANIYVFDPNEEPVSCCACPLTPNGLVSLSARNSLISNPLTPAVPTSVVVKILFTANPSGTCDAGALPIPSLNNGNALQLTLARGAVASATTLHANTSTSPARYTQTETRFESSELSYTEYSKMISVCNFIQTHASRFGLCKGCQAGAMSGSAHR